MSIVSLSTEATVEQKPCAELRKRLPDGHFPEESQKSTRSVITTFPAVCARQRFGTEPLRCRSSVRRTSQRAQKRRLVAHGKTHRGFVQDRSHVDLDGKDQLQQSATAGQARERETHHQVFQLWRDWTLGWRCLVPQKQRQRQGNRHKRGPTRWLSRGALVAATLLATVWTVLLLCMEKLAVPPGFAVLDAAVLAPCAGKPWAGRVSTNRQC